jgi:hypothetical protein
MSTELAVPARLAALTGTRVGAYTRSRRALAPTIATLALLGIIHAGGAAPMSEAYGVSALVLLPVLAWQTKLVLDGEPDTQRMLAVTAVGGRGREVSSGLLAALAPAVFTIAVGLVVPWLVGAIEHPKSGADLLAGLGYGVWIHALAAITGLAIGAWASRAVGRDQGRATLTLVGGVVLVLALGSGAADPLGWLVPRLTAIVRADNQGHPADALLLTAHALALVTLALAGYCRTRLTTRP